MSVRPLAGQNLQNYPKIQIDRASIIRPCNTDQNAADQFIDRHKSGWRKVFHDAWQEGMPFIVRRISDIQVLRNSHPINSYIARTLKYFAFLLLYIHKVYMFVYGYFYPYSQLPLDQVCNEFSRCSNWSEAVIRAFAWHPNSDRCALAICNDYVYVYHGPTRIRVLRHAQQRKITDLLWQPTSNDILVVSTQCNIIIWRVNGNLNHPLNILRETNGVRSPAYFSSNLQLVLQGKEVVHSPGSINGSIKRNEPSSPQSDSVDTVQANQVGDYRIINHILPGPIVSIQFDQSGSKLYASSPNSSKIAILRVDLLTKDFHYPNDEADSRRKTDRKLIDYMINFGQGFAKLLWSPQKDRLAMVTTSSYIRVYEPFSWSYNKWSLRARLIQDMVWSQPHGRILLVANREEPYLYALPFLDSSQAGDVGGNKSVMQALDLTPSKTENGDTVGGLIQALAWDKNGKRLAISFKENSESILLYKTDEKPTVEFHQLGVIQSETGSFPLLMEFHDKFKGGSLLTICWSDGNCQHIPMFYTPNEHSRPMLPNDSSFTKSLNSSSFLGTSLNGSIHDLKSSPRTPRSLTNWFGCPDQKQNSQ